MKKIYLNPTTDVTLLETQPVMNFASNADGTLSGGDEGNYDPDAGMQIESRRRNEWEDDELDEEY